MPAAVSPATYSKCAVSPRITAPRQMTASTVPEPASRFATSGSSNAPGTHRTVTSAASCLRRIRSAPSRSSSVMSRLKRATTIANRMPVASRSPSFAAYSPMRSGPSELLVDAVLGVEAEQVPELVLLGAQVRDVLLVRHRVHRDPLDDL